MWSGVYFSGQRKQKPSFFRCCMASGDRRVIGRDDVVLVQVEVFTGRVLEGDDVDMEFPEKEDVLLEYDNLGLGCANFSSNKRACPYA